VIFDAGGLWAVKTDVLLQRGERERILWLTRTADGEACLNMTIRDATGRPILRMRDNDWAVYLPLTDLEAVPSTRALEVRRGAVRFRVEFRSLVKSEWVQRLQRAAAKSLGDSPRHWIERMTALPLEWPALYVKLRGDMVYPVRLHFADGITEMGGITWRLSGVAHAGVAVRVS
jgi:hypothetical protein